VARNVGVVVLIGLLFIILCEVTTTAGQVNRRRPATRSAPLDEVAAAAVFPNFEALGRAAESFAKAKEYAAQANEEIATSRKAFWAQYPNGPRFAQAQATFARNLHAKDLSLLTMARLDQRCRNQTTREQAMGALIAAAGGDLDGGVLSGASMTFCRWVEASARMSPFDVTSHPFYESYRRDRDWYEFYRAGEVAFGSVADFHTATDVRWYVLALVWNGMDGDVGTPPRPPSFPDQIERAQQKVDGLVKTYGREKVFSVATRIMQAPKTPVEPPARYSYRLANAPALGCPTKPVPDIVVCFNHLVGVYAAFAANVAAGVVTDAERAEWAAVSRSVNPLDYARYLFWGFLRDQQHLDPASTPDLRRTRAAAGVSEWIKRYGESAVLEAARRVQAAPKDAQGLMNYETAVQTGCRLCGSPGTACQPRSCLENLASSPPRAAAPAATPFRPANPTPAVDTSKLSPADAAYRQGRLYLGGGRLLEAQKYFEAAIAADPRHAESHYQLGILYYRNGAQARARIALETYLKLTPNGPNANGATNFLKILP
jgi:tetratricopeptide (TPR) repeat protein